MNIKTKVFLVGGFGCIAPNIINLASKALTGGEITGSLLGVLLGGAVFFLISGFLVLNILQAKDVRDAFYKGVAVPALIISLANGVTPDKLNVPVVPTTPGKNAGASTPSGSGKNILGLFFPAPAYAQGTEAKAAAQGVVEFDLSPKDVRNISVKIMGEDGKVLSQASADGPNFKLTYAAGTYTVLVEAGSYYKQVPVTIQRNKTTKLGVTLEEKGLTKEFFEGVKTLMKR